MKALGVVFFLHVLCVSPVHAQLFREAMTAAEVEKEVVAECYFPPILQIYPDQDLMRSLHVKKVKHYMTSDYVGGAKGKARACTEFDRNGRPLSNVENEVPFWKLRRWSTNYAYLPDGRVCMTNVNPVSGMRRDTITVNQSGQPLETYHLESRSRVKYVYRETDGALLQIITTDSAGGRGIKSFSYNDAQCIIKIEEIWTTALLKDTLLLVNITRDDKNRVLHYDCFTKYQFLYNQEDPAQIEYAWTRNDYEYDSSDRIVMKAENNNFYKNPWKTLYTYEENRLKREERTADSTVRIREHYWMGRKDSVAEIWQHTNYLGQGPATTRNGYIIILHDGNGNCTEYVEYTNSFGKLEFRNRTVLQYDEQNRVVRRDFYEYDYREMQIVYRHGYSREYYPNGLQRSWINYGKDRKVQATSRYKYTYYR